MENLAGNNDCDVKIERELVRAGIDVVRGERSGGEVPASITGKLGDFTFHRAWYYWVVDCRIPLQVAQELYADPVGKTDVRVAGHAGCPPPEEWAHWFAPDGRAVVKTKEEAEFRKFEEKGVLLKGTTDDHVFSDDPQSVGAQGFVVNYHIDTEVGLRLFADTAKRHKLS